MKIADLLGFVDRLKLVQGVESDLRRRRRIGTVAGIAAILVQVVVAAGEGDYLKKLGVFISNLGHGRWDKLVGGDGGLDGNELVAAIVVVVGGTVFLLFRRTRFLLKESEEPFQIHLLRQPVPMRDGRRLCERTRRERTLAAACRHVSTAPPRSHGSTELPDWPTVAPGRRIGGRQRSG